MKEGWEEKARQVRLTWRSKWSPQVRPRQKIYRIDPFLHPNFELPNQVDSCSFLYFASSGFMPPVWDAKDITLKTWRRATQETSLEMQDTFYPLPIWRNDSYYQPLHSHMSTMLHLEPLIKIGHSQKLTFCSMIFVLPICIQRGTIFFDVTLKFPMLRWRVDLTGSQLANRRATKVGCAARVIETCSHSCMLYDVYGIHYVWLSILIYDTYVYTNIHMCFI